MTPTGEMEQPKKDKAVLRKILGLSKIGGLQLIPGGYAPIQKNPLDSLRLAKHYFRIIKPIIRIDIGRRIIPVKALETLLGNSHLA